MTSAMARASTLSFIVTPHWCEIVSSNVMSFIDLKMFVVLVQHVCLLKD